MRPIPAAGRSSPPRRDSETWLRSLASQAKKKPRGEYREWVYGHANPVGHEAEMIARYEVHNEAVRRHFADRPGQLLEVCWETGSGWRELCDFRAGPFQPRRFPAPTPRHRRPPSRPLPTGETRRPRDGGRCSAGSGRPDAAAVTAAPSRCNSSSPRSFVMLPSRPGAGPASPSGPRDGSWPSGRWCRPIRRWTIPIRGATPAGAGAWWSRGTRSSSPTTTRSRSATGI